MTITQRFSLLWRRFSPLEEQLIAAVRETLAGEARRIFDAQVAGINLVQRHPNEICFYRKQGGKVDWSDVPAFPRADEFDLAEVRFRAGGKNYKATLTGIKGHIFDFTILPGPKGIVFANWDSPATAKLVSDPLAKGAASEPQPLPDAWLKFLAGPHSGVSVEWKLHDSRSAYSTSFNDAKFLVLAERSGEQFILHRIEPAATALYYLDSHDGTPEPVTRDVLELMREDR